MHLVDLKLTTDTPSGHPLSLGPLSSQISVVPRGRPGSSRRRMSSLSLRLPVFPRGMWSSSLSLSVPQIPPLNFEDEVTEYFSHHPLFVEPSYPRSRRSSVLSEPSPTVSRHNTASQNGTHDITASTSSGTRAPSFRFSKLSENSDFPTVLRNGIQATTPSLISNASSPLEIALSTRTSMVCSRGNPRVITKGTMEGLIRHLLENLAGQQFTAY